ncbi:MAG: hypothetical protein HC908_18485, partial [Calothrix sp. SM1_7_51]|nr:hypothetical protein [Calothrix sp. SM1_7_51]
AKKSKACIELGMIQNGQQFTKPRISKRIFKKNIKKYFLFRDDGVGFDMAYANQLFCAFNRLHNRKDFPGSGVGLATAQRIINRHSGRIWVEAEVNRGAVFYFII